MNDQDRSAEERLRTANHEAGHAVMAHILGKPLDVVSIREGKGYHGVTLFESTGGFPDRYIWGVPSAGQSLARRQLIEEEILILLAGDIAAEYASAPVTGYVPEHPEAIRARELLERVFQAPTSDQAERLAEADGSEDGSSDEESISRMMRRSFPPDGGIVAALYLQFLRLEAVATVQNGTFQHRLSLLVPALLDREVLSNATVAALFREMDDALPDGLGLAASVKRNRSEGTK